MLRIEFAEALEVGRLGNMKREPPVGPKAWAVEKNEPHIAHGILGFPGMAFTNCQ